jgi:Circadian oscillating protein COP23
MKIKSKVSAVLALATVISSFGLAFTKSAEAAPRTFSCKKVSGAWTTVVNESDKPEQQIIRWTSDVGAFAGYTPERRCKEVTNRMNKYLSESGQFITYGTMNNLNVICTTNRLGKDCLHLLYTLKPDQAPKETLEDLFQVNNRNIQKSPRTDGPCPTYINVDALVAGKTRFAQEVCSTR